MSGQHSLRSLSLLPDVVQPAAFHHVMKLWLARVCYFAEFVMHACRLTQPLMGTSTSKSNHLNNQSPNVTFKKTVHLLADGQLYHPMETYTSESPQHRAFSGIAW